MEFLTQYASDSDGSDRETQGPKAGQAQAKGTPVKPLLSKGPINLAPDVTLAVQRPLLDPHTTQLITNLPAEALDAPILGPQHPLRRAPVVKDGKIVRAGIIESTNMENFAFDEQYHTFNSYGYARSVQDGQVVGDRQRMLEMKGQTVYTRTNSALRKEERKRKVAGGNPGDVDGYLGPWAPYHDEDRRSDVEKGVTTEAQDKLREENEERKKQKNKETDEEEAFDRLVERKKSHLLPSRLKSGQTAGEDSTIWHGGEERDYQGRSWIEPSKDLKPDRDGETHAAYIPKRCIHKWTGHTKGVQAIEFFPDYGHLLLSASMDTKIKIWDVYNKRNCRRTYLGHTAAVRAINFSNDGRRFLSAGYDRYIRLWDTETGKCIQSFTNRRVPYCVKFYPNDNNLFVIGDSNNMIVQFDINSGEIVQEYNHHLGAVNTVTFIDEGRRFASTSDDKKLLLWEWNIPVPIKYIAEPDMHSMPAVTLHPSGSHFACQSLNNTIVVYGAKDRFKLNRKKVFKGHSNAGFACQISFSPNGQFLMSGDGEGKVFFWDWKTCKNYKRLKAHSDGPCIGAAWHPIEPSRVATCGWDGLIKYWD